MQPLHAETKWADDAIMKQTVGHSGPVREPHHYRRDSSVLAGLQKLTDGMGKLCAYYSLTFCPGKARAQSNTLFY